KAPEGGGQVGSAGHGVALGAAGVDVHQRVGRRQVRRWGKGQGTIRLGVHSGPVASQRLRSWNSLQQVQYIRAARQDLGRVHLPRAPALVTALEAVGASAVTGGVQVDAAVQVKDERGDQHLVLAAVRRGHDREVQVDPDAVVAAAHAGEVPDIAAAVL